MAESVLSAVLPILIEKLVSETSNSIARYKGIGAEIKKCQKSLKLIQGVLTDAYQKEITSQAVKVWLNDLQHLAYDIDDVLDGWATDAMSREFTHDSEAFTSKVRKLIPSCCTNFSPSIKMHDKLDRINAELESLLKQKDEFGLSVTEEISRPQNNNRRLQTSVVDPSGIIGREAEKEAMVKQLLEDGPSDQNYSIVPIVGMGGIGKTTLARLLYDDQRVKDHFKLKAWVCVSDEFDSFRISKEIFEAMTKENKEFSNFNALQEALRDHVKGGRFLLVLDDVWSENYAHWETLVGPFYTCAPGSKIIITTRKVQLLNQLVQNPLFKQLDSLSYDDALSLFALHALGVNNFDSHLLLKPYAEGIVKKCDGLPLALRALGRLLRTKNGEVEHWKEMANSEIWRLKDEGGILPALKLSYRDLSATLKQLFLYCSLFPKDFLFDKEELILLWAAEGFLRLSTSSHSTEESLGHEFFDELLQRSFFQHAHDNESLFVMHDLMNDLATSVATEFFVRLDNESNEMLEKYRHMSFVREEYVAYKKFEAFERAKSLRTLLATSVGEVESWRTFYLSNKILTYMLPELPLLRVLSLKGFQISEVPESIGTLRHLRYLNLSRTAITHLPEKVCNLYNLQSLILFGCRHLAKLPSNFLKLKSLRHLDVKDTPLLFQMLLKLSELKSLQIAFSKIIIGSESGIEISKFKEFKNLSQKRLSELELIWSDELHDSRNEMLDKMILDELEPHTEDLKQLKIKSYGGSEFPKWVGDPSFLHLKHVSIRGCKRCTSLPPLGQLPSLKELSIEGLYGVKDVDFKLPGASCAFPSLVILSFEDMRGWKKWFGAVLPCLQQLTISRCPKLVEVTLECTPSLNVLEINDCPNLVELSLEAMPSLNDLRITKCVSHVLRRMVEVASTVTKLEISDIASHNDRPHLVEVTLRALSSLNDLRISKCDSGVLRRLVEVASAVTKLNIKDISGLNDVVWRGVIEYLGALEELKIECCNEIRYLVQSDAVASKTLVKLRKLEVNECDKLVSIGEKDEEDNCRSNLLPSLRTLDVSRCKNMESCSCPDGIEELSVWYCSSMTVVSFAKGGQEKLRSLKIIGCSQLLERELGGQEMNNSRSSFRMLDYLFISDWPNLKSIIELDCCVHLTELIIYDCESLESFPDNLTSLKMLKIENCPKLDGSTFVGDNWTSLEKLSISKCKSMDASLPGWVWPPNLRSLDIGEMKKPISEWGPQKKFPTSLVELDLYGDGEDGVSSCSEFSHILPSSLTLLNISGFEKLESVVSMGLQHLTSLQHLHFEKCPNLKKVSLHPQHLSSLHHLTFRSCPKMKDLPELLLPSLLRLEMMGCPDLEESCSKNGSYWPLISYIPFITTSSWSRT